MPVQIGRAGEYGHNNSEKAFIDSNFVRGGGREVLNLSALYGLTTKSDQLKENVTTVWVINESAFYVLTDDTNIGNANGWTELSSIIGGSGVTSVNGDIGPTVVLDADDISEAATSPTNLYYTSTRFDNSFSAKDTDNLSEGAINLYYTDARFDSRLNASSVTGLSDVSSAGSGQIITPQERTSISTNTTAISALGTELTDTQTGAGLNANGTYPQNTNANYIAAVASLNAADVALDTQIKTNETNISTNVGNISSNSSAISTNATNIGSNSTSISTNTTNIASNTSSISTNAGNISTNSNSISSLDTRVTAAEGNITTNTSAIATKQDLLTFGIANTNAVDIDSPSATISSGQYARFTANGLEGRSTANVLSDIGAASSVALSAVSGTVSANATNITANAADITANAADIASNLSAIQSNDTDIAANTTAISNEATARANADTALQNQITANAADIATNVTAISSNTTHSGIISGNPHGTSITNLVGVPSTLGSYKNVLTVDQAGTALEYSDLIEEITNEVLDLVNTSSSYTLNSADINGDGIVSVDDLLILLSQYGTTASTAFTAGWLLDDSNSTIPYTGSTNESDATDSPSDSNTNLLLIETPINVSAYSPWTITTNTNNETVTISQSNGDSAESVEYSKDLDFIGDVFLEVQQTSNLNSNYYVFLKAVYSYPTASDHTEWHFLGQFSHGEANYDPAGGAGAQRSIFGLSNVENLFEYTSSGSGGPEYPSSVTMSFRYMKSVTEGDGYLRLKYVDFQWRS